MTLLLRRFVLGGLFLAGWGSVLSRVHGEIFIDLASPTVLAGQSDTVQVQIRSGAAETQDIAFYDLEFEITSLSGNQPGTTLRFVSPASNVFAAAGDASNPNGYVLGGMLGGNPDLFVSNGTTADSLLATTDFTTPDANATLTTTGQLLTQFDVKHVIPMGADLLAFEGDQFQIELIASVFESYDSATDSFEVYAGAVNTTGGLITITGVPEPGCIALFGFATGLGVVRRRLNRRRSQTHATASIAGDKHGTCDVTLERVGGV